MVCEFKITSAPHSTDTAIGLLHVTYCIVILGFIIFSISSVLPYLRFQNLNTSKYKYIERTYLDQDTFFDQYSHRFLHLIFQSEERPTNTY